MIKRSDSIKSKEIWKNVEKASMNVPVWMKEKISKQAWESALRIYEKESITKQEYESKFLWNGMNQ